MICLPNNLPLLRIGQHETGDYQHDWLKEVVHEAAIEAGLEHWTHHGDVTSAFFTWLERAHLGTVVSLPELFERLARALRETGCPAIAARLELTAPPLAIHLPELATGCFGELPFYTRLGKRLQPIATGTVRTLVCTGLAESVKLLNPATRLGRRRRSTRISVTTAWQIRSFIHDRCQRIAPGSIDRIWFPETRPALDSDPIPIAG